MGRITEESNSKLNKVIRDIREKGAAEIKKITEKYEGKKADAHKPTSSAGQKAKLSNVKDTGTRSAEIGAASYKNPKGEKKDVHGKKYDRV